ncbi:hypothetical protein AURDEDRAFT_177834, partial [Auricularia subglabra TFB-10046 SS5]
MSLHETISHPALSVEMLIECGDAEYRCPRSLRVPANPPPPRPPTHLAPRKGPFVLNPLPGIGQPDGIDCTVLASKWQEVQREAMFDLRDSVGWMRLEGGLPANPQLAAHILFSIWQEVFPGERDPDIIGPWDNEDGEVAASIAFVGERRQVARLTSICTWSCSLGTVQFFPNHPMVSHFACTFGGTNFPLSAFAKVARMVRHAILSNPEICEYIIRNGRRPEAIAASLELEHLVLIKAGIEIHLWNVMLTPPIDIGEDWFAIAPRVAAWRQLVARLHPVDFPTDVLKCYESPFRC